MKIIFSILAVIGFFTVWTLTIGAALWACGVLNFSARHRGENCEGDKE